ncbi:MULTISPECIES: hypothetical protein [Burkholderia]|nr:MULTISPECIES: hypothetical protein [Burkholderia]
MSETEDDAAPAWPEDVATEEEAEPDCSALADVFSLMTKVWRVGHAENQREFIMLQYTIGGKPTAFRQYCCNVVSNSRRRTLQSRDDAHDSACETARVRVERA